MANDTIHNKRIREYDLKVQIAIKQHSKHRGIAYELSNQIILEKKRKETETDISTLRITSRHKDRQTKLSKQHLQTTS